MLFGWYIVPFLIIYYWSSTTFYFFTILWICSFYVLGVLLQLLLLLPDFFVRFSSCALLIPQLPFASFLFSSLILSLRSPFYVPLFLISLSYSFFLLQSQSPWYYHHHLTLRLFLILQICFAAVLLLTY